MTEIRSEILRDESNYKTDILENDSRKTGINQNCILNNIPSFNVVKNYAVDIRHDLFEGICHYDLCQAILYFIEERYFTLDLLNKRKMGFSYGETEIGNLSSPISMERLKNNSLKMSA